MAGRDDNTLGGRVRRYARVGGAVGGLAARVAGARYLGMPIDRERHAGELTAALGGIKGPLMKVAQILATIPDALPDAYARELRTLQADAPAMGWSFVKRRMASELGPDWMSRFASFERTAAHAASLGQVHRAKSHDGRDLACKLQYPDMASAVEADLSQLGVVFRLYARGDRGIDTAKIHDEIADRLREELDYTREGRHMALYGAMLANEDAVRVPQRIDDLSTKRLLTMTWLEGRPLLDFRDAPAATRNAIAQALFRAWYVPFYGHAVIHGDPHPGNYAVRPDHTLNLLDFGCVRVFKPSFVRGVIDLYRALRDGDRDLAVESYRTWGFTDLRREVIDTLNIWAEFLYAPLLKDGVQRIQESESGLYGAEVAGRVHRELRRIGGVTPPREFVFMDRAAVGLGAVFMQLRAEINWHRLFHEMIDDFDLASLANRQRDALAAAGLQPA